MSLRDGSAQTILRAAHTEIEVADQTFYLTQSQYTDTGSTSPSADPIMPGAWQGSHWSANFEVTGMTRPRKILAQEGFEPGIFRSRGGHLTTWPSVGTVQCMPHVNMQGKCYSLVYGQRWKGRKHNSLIDVQRQMLLCFIYEEVFFNDIYLVGQWCIGGVCLLLLGFFFF